jgi:hypothetical protein
MPSWSQIARAVSNLMTERDGEWCGFPMPLPGLGLVLESRHPLAEKVAAIQQIVDEGRSQTTIACSEDDMGWRVVNSWPSSQKGGTILVVHHEDGRKTWALDAWAPRRNRFWLGPLETLDAWNLDTEMTTPNTLAEGIAAKRRQIEASGFAQWEYQTPAWPADPRAPAVRASSACLSVAPPSGAQKDDRCRAIVVCESIGGVLRECGAIISGGRCFNGHAEAELLAAAKVALDEMCRTTAPRDNFTDAVDGLDAAITNAASSAPPPSPDWSYVNEELIAARVPLSEQIVAAMNAEDWRKATFLLIAKVDGLYRSASPPVSLEDPICPKCGKVDTTSVEEDDGSPTPFITCNACGEVFEAESVPPSASGPST